MQQHHVLIVEDELPLQLAMKKKLEQHGFVVGTAKNGEEGIEYALSKHPDAILLDIVMPLKDGSEMLQELRNDPWGATVPVVIASNYSEPHVMNLAEKHNVHEYLIKSDSPIDSIVEAVKTALQ